jgi:prolyl 4-hydroxylase
LSHPATDLRHFIRIYDGALEPALCRRIIALFEGAPQAQGGPRGRRVGERDNERGFNWVQMNTADLPAFAEIDLQFAEIVKRHAERYAAETGATLFPFGFEEFLVKRYRAAPAEQFPPHVDVSSALTMHRMLAVLAYLTDVPDGGETYFGPPLDTAVEARQGRLMLFPPIFLYPHAGLPPLRGDKYILGTYLTYIDPRQAAAR